MNTNHKVLVIDDDRDLNSVLTDKLKDEGFTVSSAYDGEHGLEQAFAEHPDLILLDILMPKMDGWEMLDKLREDEWGRTAKVILLTVLEDVASISQSRGKGEFEYLVKTDWSLEEVVKKIDKKLNG